MSLTSFFGLLGGLLVLAFVANRLAKRTRVPDAVVLILTGVLVGPVLGLVRADQFENVTRGFGTLALILISNLLVVLGSVRARHTPAPISTVTQVP